MKIGMIVCWIGKLPDYFKIWEFSCSKNPDYEFLIFTDNPQNSIYKNIKFIKFSLDDFNSLASKKLNMQINVKKPYKLCDFRPAYGLIFEDYLQKYDFWGHCDIDQIFGKINDFINFNMLNSYDKINKNGHFVLYKNNKKMNNIFKEKGSLFNYKEIFYSNENFAFDEYTGINMIIKENKIKCLFINDFADIDKAEKRYTCKNHQNYKYQFYYYLNGKIFKVYIDNGIRKKEMMYLHFQKKTPNINIKTFDECIAIGYKSFRNINEKNITKNTIKSINGCENKFLKFFEKGYYIFKKFKEFLLSSKEKKRIWIKQKKSMEEYK